MGLPNHLIREVQHLAKAQMEFLGDAYGDLANGAVQHKVIPIYRAIDALNSQSRTKVDCREGCDFCCHYHVYATPIEVFAIAEHIRTLRKHRQVEILAAVRNYAETVKEWGWKRHEVTNIACSFLSEGRCTIYPVRPLACRRHHSADRAVCERTFIDTLSQEEAPMDAVRVVVSTAFQTLHAKYHAAEGMDRDAYELHAALHEALTDSRCRQRWNAGKPAFVKVRDWQPSEI